MSAAALSVRDQAMTRALDVVARQRNLNKQQADGTVTSTYRKNSEAHKRGAFDISVKTSKNPGAEAAKIRDSLGAGFLVIHEQPSADKKTQTNTYYYPDGSSKTVTKPYGGHGFQATGAHIHVQPQKEMFEKK